MTTMRYRKLPVEIEAVQYLGDKLIPGICECDSASVIHCHTLEGFHVVSHGDWIITGVKGEKYPCKPDIFDMTYEPADQPGAMEKIKKIVDAQADDAALWAIPIDQRISEAYLQQELRKLHAAIEGDL
jgi:hypothetical protein